MTTPGPDPDDLAIWEGIFADVPEGWRTAPPSKAMLACRDWLAERGVTSILDLGCGVGRWAVWLARQGFDVAGSDFSANGVDYARAWAEEEGLEIPFVCAPATEIPFPERRFDAVVAALVLDLMSTEEFEVALDVIDASLARVGWLFAVFNPLTCSTEDSFREGNPTAGITQISYTDSHLEAIVGDAGFEVVDRAEFELDTRGLLLRRT